MDIPVSALILAAIGSLYLTKVVFSWITFLAETFMFSGMSVSAIGLLETVNSLAERDWVVDMAVEGFRRQERQMGW
jgi:hypothetical protein